MRDVSSVGQWLEWCCWCARRGIKYGFTITVLEGPSTIPTLWEHTRGFMQRNADLIPEDNLMEFVTGRDGGYNLCHFWSNFELGDLRFFRSQVRWSGYRGNISNETMALHPPLLRDDGGLHRSIP